MKISPKIELVHPSVSGRSTTGAFSIIELLSVVAIMGIVTAMTMVSFGGGPWKHIQSGANVLGSHIDLARQQAIMNGCLTALVVATDGVDAFQSFAVMKKLPTGWSQLTPWKKLPEGVTLKNEEETALFALPENVYSDMEMPAIRKVSESLEPGTDYEACFFYANGQVRGDAPSKLRLAWKADQANPDAEKRYMDVVLIPASGKVKYTSR